EGSGPWDLHPDDTSAAPGLELIDQATAALRNRLETYLDARDEAAQTDAALGLDGEEPRALRLLERYAADARRQFSRHLNEWRRLQSRAPRAADASAEPRSAPAGPPGPRPDRTRRRQEAAPPPPSPSDPDPTPPPA